jgi:hypothetical protein
MYPENAFGYIWGRSSELQHIALCKLDGPLTAQQLQQHRDAFVWAHAVKHRELTGEDPASDAHPIAVMKLRRRRQLDKPAAFALSELGDHFVGHPGGLIAAHDQLDHARAPAGRMPLQLDQHEGVAGKQRRHHGDLAAVDAATLADPRQIGGIAPELEAMQRQALAVGLELRGATKNSRCNAFAVRNTVPGPMSSGR